MSSISIAGIKDIIAALVVKQLGKSLLNYLRNVELTCTGRKKNR